MCELIIDQPGVNRRLSVYKSRFGRPIKADKFRQHQQEIQHYLRMFRKATIALLIVVATHASDSFLGIERYLQTQGTVFTSSCTADSGCSVGNCCADYRRINGSTTTNITKTCVSTQLHNRVVLFSGLNHTWVCGNTTAVTANAGTACTTNAGCTTSGQCCQQTSFGIWGVLQNVSTVCRANTSSGVTTFQQYNVGTSPSNFTANVTYRGTCLASTTTTTNTSTSTNTTTGGTTTNTGGQITNSTTDDDSSNGMMLRQTLFTVCLALLGLAQFV
ncbi:hypothetical protein FGO68_gene8890 [Halteria grandinella]|uniref:Uncharacterized protein n=1 Tax=Halteria grandinella TaxID=5974 RepID=A0A8J8SZF1_HALGN|nr:hypothetical protein FGO68_gene8890 [Halteria grandinella]